MSPVVNRIRPGDGDPRHGTVGSYTNHRCRCPDCTEAWRRYCIEDYLPRIRAVGLPIGDARHGTYNGYYNYRCRCDECRAANAVYRRDYYRRNKAVS